MSLLSRLGVVADSSRRVAVGLLASRAYGSAAAAQLDYYDEDEEYEWLHRDQRRARPMLDSEGWVPARGVQWVVIGDPGAKKHVYAERLAKLLEVPHISMGSLVRQELNPNSSIYQQIAKAVSEGKLVPEEMIFGLLSKRLEEGHSKGETGFILDGIPRTKIQAEILDQMADIDLVVNFKSAEELLVKKNLGTGKFTSCREYSSISSSSGCNLNLPREDVELKSTAANISHAWKEKFRNYADQRKPVEDYYRKQRKMIDFQVTGGPGETWQGLLAALHLQHINAMWSSQKLTA